MRAKILAADSVRGKGKAESFPAEFFALFDFCIGSR
jgi:hypothetical protein